MDDAKESNTDMVTTQSKKSKDANVKILNLGHMDEIRTGGIHK